MNNRMHVFIIHGFNRYFSIPRFCGKRVAHYRTAIVLKKRDFFDDWNMYSMAVCRIFLNLSNDLRLNLQIKCPESDSWKSVVSNEREALQCGQITMDSVFSDTPPTNIRFTRGEKLVALALLEDWSDIVHIEPYMCSFTYSFYSDDFTVDTQISKSIVGHLSSDSEVEDIQTLNEYDTPKWYWPILDVVHGILK